MKHNSNVPAFLTKLWTLVEDADTNEFICWSQEGNSFMVLDEQRFAKEILPKFFKHNNMASFIRQLNMYGFRKVMHIDTGIVKQEKDGPVEFQHPYFKHGQDDLLENIKRKVSNARPEDNKIRQEDLSKILVSVQSVHSKQENIDARLATLKRENEALWREVSDLRQKHVHQQQLIKKLIHFIVTLVQNNHILNLKRKRPILMNGNGKKPKYIHQIYDDKVCVEQSTVNSLNGVKSSELSDDVIICDLTESEAEGSIGVTEGSTGVSEASTSITEGYPKTEQGEVEIVEVELDGCAVLAAETEVSTTCTDDKRSDADAALTDDKGGALEGAGATSSALQLNKAPGLSLEDPVKMMDSILNENGAISQNINLLGKVELMDYLDSIDCSLEDFQAMLYGKQFGMDLDAVEESVASKENTSQLNRSRTEDTHTDKQLIQYTSCPLLAFLDGCPHAPELDLGSSSSSSSGSAHPSTLGSAPSSAAEAKLPSELLDSGVVESKQPVRSSLIRLEPLTEAQASEETLFYLCELSPGGLEADSTQLDRL
ncbi:LOW QUALITY PROTEIN: heat shock factor protein 2-like [Sphaeramia orbicularis]|uniref:heat shock factor protein 2-like n=1 Tax=Sphaeramia orbicularis TaxID=375764 RepID=UPI00117EC5CB|nr:heat shock factor protein 2-like [Sphaeramia orbicularis]XP_029984121.1 LOW QUALITY PROTEIN: heat shock factor protein 2-like [Sphaeramia orbicularis]